MTAQARKGAATQVYFTAYDRRFFALPKRIQSRLDKAVCAMGRQLDRFPHHRMKGTTHCRLRVGEYRVIYNVDLEENTIYLITVGHRRDIYR